MGFLKHTGMWILLIVLLDRLYVFFMSMYISRISAKKERANNVLEFLKSRPLSSIKNRWLGLERSEK